MGINKIVLNTDEGDRVLVDLTGDSVTPETTFAGTTFHAADGEAKTGTFTIRPELDEQGTLIEQIAEALDVTVSEADSSSGDSRLPDQYQEVEYIESTGTQWLDTGVTINTATDEVEFIFQNTESEVYKWFFGEHDNNARFGMGSGDGTNKRNVAYGASTYKVTDKQMYDTRHTFVANENGVFLDDAKVANFSSFVSTSTLYLFNLNLSGGNYVSDAKCWGYKHKRNGSLIRNLIPCYRKSDGKVGMYDTVTETLYTNAGGGEFLYGSNVVPSTGYNAELQANNADLRSILDAANELPDGVELPELTNEGSAADLLSGKQLIDGEGNVVTGTLVPKADPVLQSKTVTPTKSVQNVVPDNGYDGLDKVTINAIPTQYITTADATASANEIMSGETAYVNGSKVTGTFTIDNELATQDNLIAQIQSALFGKAVGDGVDIELCEVKLSSTFNGAVYLFWTAYASQNLPFTSNTYRLSEGEEFSLFLPVRYTGLVLQGHSGATISIIGNGDKNETISLNTFTYVPLVGTDITINIA